jgi:tetratricopeptide (TPR) repeat protein
MRTLVTLTLFVSLTHSASAQDWVSVHNSGIDAVGRHDFQTAIALFRKSETLTKTERQKAVTANDIGVVLHQAGRDADARGYLEASLALWKTIPGENRRFAQTAGALSTVNRLLGDYAGAESLLRDALTLPGLDSDANCYILEELGDILREQGRFTEARGLLRQSLELAGPYWKQQLNTLIGLAELDRDTRNWAASVDEWNQAAELARKNHYPGAEAACARGLGQTWLDQRNLARAEPLLKTSLAMFESPALRDESQIASTLMSLGELYLAQDKPSVAEEFLERALKGDEKTLGPEHPQVALVLEALAETFAVRNQPEVARDYMNQAERIIARRFGEGSTMTAGVLAVWGSLEQRMNHPELAAVRYRKALDTLKSADPDMDPLREHIARQFADVLKATHHKREAAEVLASIKSFR